MVMYANILVCKKDTLKGVLCPGLLFCDLVLFQTFKNIFLKCNTKLQIIFDSDFAFKDIHVVFIFAHRKAKS